MTEKIAAQVRKDTIYELLKHFKFSCPGGEVTPICDMCSANLYCIELRSTSFKKEAIMSTQQKELVGPNLEVIDIKQFDKMIEKYVVRETFVTFSKSDLNETIQEICQIARTCLVGSNHDPEVRDAIRIMAQTMEKKFRKHDNWGNPFKGPYDEEFLINRTEEEKKEFLEAISAGKLPSAVWEEAADYVNFILIQTVEYEKKWREDHKVPLSDWMVAP